MKITDAVKSVLEFDHQALVALQRGIMNFSSYAREIEPKINEISGKKVDVKSIIVCLSRISKSIEGKNENLKEISISNLLIHPTISIIRFREVNFGKDKLSKMYRIVEDISGSFFFSIYSNDIDLALTGDGAEILVELNKVLSIDVEDVSKEDLAGLNVKVKFNGSTNHINTNFIIDSLPIQGLEIRQFFLMGKELLITFKKEQMQNILTRFGQNF